MKRLLLFACLFGFFMFGPCSLFAAEGGQNSGSQFFKTLQSPRWTLEQEAQERPTYSQIWNGKGNWVPLRVYMRLWNAQDLGLTEEQSARLAFLRKDSEIGVDIIREKIQQQDPVLMQARERARNAIPQNDPQLDNATYEQQREYVKASSQSSEVIQNAYDEIIEQTLTPEQMLKLQEFKLQVLPEMGFPSIAMFDTLGLTDEQRLEMEAIKRKMEPEFEKLVDEAMELKSEEIRLMIQELTEMNKVQRFENDEQMLKKMGTAAEKAGKNKGLQEKRRANSKKGQEFATLFKSRLMNVLTDEQLDKMQKIMDNSPDFIEKFLAEKNKQRTTQEKAGVYAPGPDSWRPGDGAPKDFKKERKSRFPKRKS